MFVKQKRFIDLFIDLIYWFGMIFFSPRSIHECATNTIRENAASAAWMESEAQQAAACEDDLMKKNDFCSRNILHSTACPESIMMTNQDGMRLRVANDV